MLTIILLAEVAPAAGDFSGQSLKEWLAIFFYVVGGITALVGLYKMVSGKNGATEIADQPIHVKTVGDLVSKQDHEKAIGEIKQELTRHAARRAEIYTKQSEHGAQLQALSAQTNATKETVAKVEGKIDANTALTARIDGKVEQINQNVHALTNSVTQFIREHRK